MSVYVQYRLNHCRPNCIVNVSSNIILSCWVFLLNLRMWNPHIRRVDYTHTHWSQGYVSEITPYLHPLEKWRSWIHKQGSFLKSFSVSGGFVLHGTRRWYPKKSTWVIRSTSQLTLSLISPVKLWLEAEHPSSCPTPPESSMRIWWDSWIAHVCRVFGKICFPSY